MLKRRVKVVPNGADVNTFRPYEKDAVRRRLKNDEFIVVYEGYWEILRLEDTVFNKIRLPACTC